MDYEKAYNEALNRAKLLKDHPEKVVIEKYKGSIHASEIIFPELRESEDVKIKKELIDFVKSRLAGFPQCEKFIAWLEKQRPVEEIIERYKTSWFNEGKIQGKMEGLSDDEKYQQGWHDALENQGEHKPVDNIESKFKVGD